jgi:hypothetical protein
MKQLKKYSLNQLKRAFSSMTIEEISEIIGAGCRYRVDRQGNIREEHFEGDGYYALSEDGKIHNLDGALTISSEYIPADEDNPYDTVATNIQGADVDFFKFLASNTDVEWGASYTPGSNAYITTINEEHSNHFSFQNGYTHYIHSHPTEGEYQTTPSSEDINTGVGMYRKALNNVGQYNTWEIYVPQSSSIENYTNDVHGEYHRWYD